MLRVSTKFLFNRIELTIFVSVLNFSTIFPLDCESCEEEASKQEAEEEAELSA